MTLTDSTVSGNTAGSAGGIAIQFNGTLTLTNSTVSDNSAASSAGGIYGGTVTLLTKSTVSDNTAGTGGGGIETNYTLILDESTVSGNSAASDGGGISIRSNGTLTLTNSIVEGNSAQGRGGGIYNGRGFDYEGTHRAAMVTLTNTRVSDNTTGTSGGGVSNGDLLTLTNSTVSGNTSTDRGGGVYSAGTVTLTNSTVSSNTAADRGGGIENTGTVTFTNSTISRNASGRVAGGLFNTGTVTLIESLLTGNTAPVIGPEAYNVSGNVIGDRFNVFGHDGFSGAAGLTVGATDLVPAVPLSAILDPNLGYNGGPTRTHGLVFGSPAVDAVPGAACATGTDQRGAPRPQDADGDTIPDCDIGAVERGLIPIQAEIISTTLDCRTRGCRVSVRCNLLETECRNPIDITVRRAAVRAADGTLVRAPRRFRFAAGVTNIPPGGTQTMRLPLTPRGTRVVRTTEKKRLTGLLAIREIGATATNTPPATISNTLVRLRLRRR